MSQTYQTQACCTDTRCLIRYHLVSVSPCGQANLYFLNVYYNDDFVCAYVGDDRERALQIYRFAVAGNVTPCTLEDIVEDAGIFAKTDSVAYDKKFLSYME